MFSNPNIEACTEEPPRDGQALNASDGEILWTFQPDTPVWNFLALFPDKADGPMVTPGRWPFFDLGSMTILLLCIIFTIGRGLRSLQIDEMKMDFRPLIGGRFQILGVCLFCAMSFVSV